MRCPEFERLWNDRLDAVFDQHDRSGSTDTPVFPADHGLDQHAALCVNCRRLAVRFTALERILVSGLTPPVAPAQLKNRILAAAHNELSRPARWRKAWPALLGPPKSVAWRYMIVGSVAASLLGVASAIFGLVVMHLDEPTHHAATSNSSANQAPTLKRVLANASTATWNLARDASQPAASIGRDLFEAAIPDSFGATTVTSLVPNTTLTPLTLERIGDQLVLGTRPLSSAARRAFGFLVLPTIQKNPGPRAITPAAKRA